MHFSILQLRSKCLCICQKHWLELKENDQLFKTKTTNPTYDENGDIYFNTRNFKPYNIPQYLLQAIEIGMGQYLKSSGQDEIINLYHHPF